MGAKYRPRPRATMGKMLEKIERRSLISSWLVLGLSLAWSSSARAQFTSGTTIVFSLSQSKVIVAADSRDDVQFGSRHIVRDDACKIVALEKNLLFTVAGTAGERHTKSTSLNWSAFDEAARAFSSYRKAQPTEDVVNGVATRWATAAKRAYTQMEERDVKGFVAGTTSDIVAEAIFIGLDRRGDIEARKVSVTFRRGLAAKGGFVPISVKSQPWEISRQTVLKAAGHAEIAYEFSAKTTYRAKTEAYDWEIEKRRHPLEDADVLNAVHLVRLSILYAPKEWGVGGDVDVAEITPSSGVRWVSRKHVCPEMGLSPVR
jgi:hypothetical protein